MSIDPTAAAVAGLLAGQLMEAPTYLQRAAGLGLRQDIFAEGGAILRAPRRYRRLGGWAGHATLAAAIVLLYATFFQAVAHNDHLAPGGACSPAPSTAFSAGSSWAPGPTCTPTFPTISPAGVFYRHYGRHDVVEFVIGHLWFGLAAGVLYALLHAGLPPGAAL